MRQRKYKTGFSVLLSIIGVTLGCSSSPASNSKDSSKTRFIRFYNSHPDLIWASPLEPNTQKALDDYTHHRKTKNGLEYGASVRKLNLAHRSAREIDQDAKNLECNKKLDHLKDVKTQAPLKDASGNLIPMTVYLCPDGGVIRVKPNGDPTSKLRPQAHASKSLRYPADSAYESFNDEALKVDNLGNPIPKWKKDLNLKASEGEIPLAEFIEGWAEDAHTDLPVP